MFDLLILNASIIDGTGKDRYISNVGIKGDKIKYIGKEIIEAHKTIDVDGLILTPGFVDGHSHDDIWYFNDPNNYCKLSMGVTTTISGNCGESSFPVAGKYKKDIIDYFSLFKSPEIIKNFTSVKKYIKLLGKQPLGINAGIYIGHGTIRIATMGYSTKKPSEKQLEKMKLYVEDAMKSGAFGLSTGLLYPPGSFSDTHEIIELCKVVAKYGGIYVSHIRHEGMHLVKAVEEAIRIGKEAGIGVIISHLKVMGKHNEGLSINVLNLINKANHEGLMVSGDVYPYTSGCTYLPALLPVDIVKGGFIKAKERVKEYILTNKLEVLEKSIFTSTPDWVSLLKCAGYEGILILSSPSCPEARNKTIKEFSVELNIKPIEVLLDLFIKDDVNCLIAMFTNTESDMENYIQNPYVMFGSDGITIDENTIIHPRTTGTFPKIIRKYVREKGLLSLEEAVRKMTSLTCEKIGIKNKGVIKEGADADIVIFNKDKITDNSNFIRPYDKSTGIEYVIVNGKIKLRNGKMTDEVSGKVIKRN